MRFPSALLLLLLAIGLAPIGLASARAQEGLGAFERPVQGTRDAHFNRTVTHAAEAGRSASALANSVVVSQSGRGNTLSLVIDQVNRGTVSARVGGAPRGDQAGSLNGRLDLD